jgi:hypothetical protein
MWRQLKTFKHRKGQFSVGMSESEEDGHRGFRPRHHPARHPQDKYSGADHNAVPEILGHTTATMALRVYARSRPPGAADDRMGYYGSLVVRMDGSELAKNESI